MRDKLAHNLQEPVVVFHDITAPKAPHKVQVGPYDKLVKAIKAESAVLKTGVPKVNYIRR